VNRIIPKLEKVKSWRSLPASPRNSRRLCGRRKTSQHYRDRRWLAESGAVARIGNIADPENWPLSITFETAVKAHALYRRDVEYVIKTAKSSLSMNSRGA